MNYPIWELTYFGGGSLVAFISVLHVYISHLAVGGGIFIWLTDRKAVKENSAEIKSYIKKYTWFFLLITMVFGGMSGVGIWFIIALVNPAATSTLIHNFVFGWAIEWVFFLGEIVALLMYHYRFDFLTSGNRLKIAFLYALFAWLSLVIINGILAFMLTPGEWINSGEFWDGFFNPTYFPSLIFRTAMAILIAGIFGFVTITKLKSGDFKTKMIKYSSKWLLYPIPFLILSAFWYFYSIPSKIRITAFSLNNDVSIALLFLLVTSMIIFISSVIIIVKAKSGIQKSLVYILILIGLIWMGGFEYSRENARRPYIITDYMYSTSIIKSDLSKINTAGILSNAKWTEIKEITESNRLAAGKEIFNLQCLSCHTVNGIRNDIVPLTKDFTFIGMKSLLTGQGKVLNYMTPFAGTDLEKDALAEYIIAGLQNKPVNKEIDNLANDGPYNSDPLEFNSTNDEYILLAWNDLGMHCITDSDPWFVILPPANTLEAQLIKRGDPPNIVTEGVELRYSVQDGFRNPSEHVPFWDYSKKIFGADLEKNVGLFGQGVVGKMKLKADGISFIAPAIPVAPYSDDKKVNPFPIFTIEAVDTITGKVLAAAKAVTPTSTEMGCRNCHGGGWKVNGKAGVADETAINILKAHDKLSGTNLYKDAIEGNPKLCQSCHPDPALGAKGIPGVNFLSSSIHGFHANYMYIAGSAACAMCHPASPAGNTKCMRGVHNSAGVGCVDCHGTLSEHGASLLKTKPELEQNSRMLSNLSFKNVSSQADINARTPWAQEPDCLTCHENFEAPAQNKNSFNTWNKEFNMLYRERTGDAGMVRCEACHGSTHALYPAKNMYDKNRDNLQPLQYMKNTLPIGSQGNCICHTIQMDESIHHPNMNRPFRNKQILD